MAWGALALICRVRRLGAGKGLRMSEQCIRRMLIVEDTAWMCFVHAICIRWVGRYGGTKEESFLC